MVLMELVTPGTVMLAAGVIILIIAFFLTVFRSLTAGKRKRKIEEQIRERYGLSIKKRGR